MSDDREGEARTEAVARCVRAAAERALKEAEARRRAGAATQAPREHGGRGAPEPVRYGDWEVKGIASDF